ncbi:hypothetical protein [Roseivirga sp. 4D4]|uniref:hypothetical protein n=1 Tax=Roseivirga sp. 4D4 TaxID=1889784 RepID=UPI001112FC2D|nr:hypothetical protein [Roseivirga sp. 4D4]
MSKLKNVVTLWGIVYLIITLLFYGLSQWLSPMPIYMRTLVLSGLMVFILQYLVLPGLKRLRNIKTK